MFYFLRLRRTTIGIERRSARSTESCHGLRGRRGRLFTLWQVRIEKAEHMRVLDDADAFLFLQLGNLAMEPLHRGPVHLRTEMMLLVVAIVEEEPIIDLPVAAHAPRDGLVRVRAVMAVKTIQITEAVAEIEKRQEIEKHVTPVKQEHHEQGGSECGQFNVAPKEIAVAALAQFPTDRTDIVPEKAEEHVTPWILRFAVVAMFIDRNPVNGLASFVRPIGVAFMVLHVDGVVVGLRKAT